MRKILAIAVVAVMGLTSVASAAPKAIYNPATGNVVFVNDTAAAFPAAYLLSASSALTTDGSKLMDIPGATKDNADLPMGYTYLNLPVGTFNTGNMVTPGTALADLTFQYYEVSLTTPVKTGTVELAVNIPEPTTLAMAGLGLIGVVAAARRKA